MQKSYFFIYAFLLLVSLGRAQRQSKPFKTNTSGYLESQSSTQKANTLSATVSPMSTNTMSNNDVVPTIKGELNVSAQGSLTYTIPIEVFKGVNSFQPNLALAYSSDGGNGQAGYGWNLVGLSVITQGGKSKHIDGVFEGPQFNSSDPYYLDGQRLIQVGNSSDYQTEQFSHIKIKRTYKLGRGYVFNIQYPDGKLAIYEQITDGQYYIVLMEDAYGNQIEYSYDYDNEKRTPYLDTIKYGKVSGTHPFTISFEREDRYQPVTVWRNRKSYTNDKVLKEIHVSSTFGGLYRKYILTHDFTHLGYERLRILDVENAQGQRLRPLNFNYNASNGRVIVTDTEGNPGLPSNSERLGGMTVGNFYGDDDVSALYWVSTDNYNPNRLISSKQSYTGITYHFTHKPELYSGKIIQNNGKLSERDQLIEYTSKVLNSEILEGGLYYPKTELKFVSRDLNSRETHEVVLHLKGSYEEFLYCEDDPWLGAPECYYSYTEEKKLDGLFVNDFNNDGLIDILIAQPELSGSPVSGPSIYQDRVNLQTLPSTSKAYFVELGKYIKNGGELTYEEFTGNIPYEGGDLIEFNGDGIPEILKVNTRRKNFDVFKLNFSNNTITRQLWNHSLTNDFTEDTPLIYGDFNGDGLTDFITPAKVFKLDGNSTQGGESAFNLIQQIESSRLIWHQYINRGRSSFLRSTRDFTSAKLAYCAPNSSYHHIKIKRSSFWKKLWSGTPDTAQYLHSDFGTSTVVPVDFNNDGKTDLVSMKKFGQMEFNKHGSHIMGSDNLRNFSTVGRQILVLDSDAYNDCVNGCSSTECELNCGDSSYKYITLTEDIANNVVFHETVYSADYEFSLLSHNEESEYIGDIKISPYSFFINSQLSNGLDSYQNKLVLYDPYEKRNHIFKINSDEFLETHIQEIDNSSGVIENIQYTSLQKRINNKPNKFYKYNPDGFNHQYPYYIHKQMPLKFLVARVNTLFDNKSLSKEYRYENAIQHLDGLGFLGFQKTYSSDVYESQWRSDTKEYYPKNLSDPIFWTVNTYDPEQQNQLIKTTYGSTGKAVFTESTVNYQRFERSNQRYLYLKTQEHSTDYLKDVTVSKTHTYTNDLLLQSTTTNYDDVGSSTATFQYQSPWNSGDHFYHGRIKRTQNVRNAYGDSFSTHDEYSNFNSAGIPLTQKTYGHNTGAITTQTTYDTFGNKTSETVSANGVTSLTTSYGYDNTKRFITTVIDPEGIISTSRINIHGWLEEETSALGIKTKHTYDAWGNPLTSTSNYGTDIAITTTLVKTMVDADNGIYSLSTTTPGQPQTIVIFDKFDRKIRTKTQSINNKWTLTDTEYDVFGKTIRESEPYFEGETPSLWNATDYDHFDRPVLQTAYNGKVITTCYEGLKVTVVDGEKKHSKTLDAMGNTIYNKDFGGEIRYKYYANGTLREANYDGITIKVEQDGWGNKTKLDDPSAGVYQYEYDALGRKLKEITPKGTTTYGYDDFGKLISERTVGDLTNLSTQYEYHPTTKLPTRIFGTNGTDSFMYETHYDSYYRITGKTETHPQFTYHTETEFDNTFNRADIIKTSTTINANGQTVNTAIKNHYEPNSGILTRLSKSGGGNLWTIGTVNAKGQTTQLHYGNGYQVTNTYNTYYLPENVHHYNSGNDKTALHLEYHFNNTEGLLLQRNNRVFQKNESFEYDDLHRLTKEILNGNLKNQYTYDKRGRITFNSDIGQYNYASTNYQISSLNLTATGKQLKDNRGFAKATFNSYKKAVNIHLQNKERINFTYNLFKDRTAMYYGSEAEDKLARPYRKYYSSDKAVELKHDVANNTWEVLTYLDGDPYSANVVEQVTFTNGQQPTANTLYLHRDYQSTILAISESNGNIAEQRFFDAWGNLNKLKQESTVLNAEQLLTANPELLIIDRGYTGHEMLLGVGLIHMNGRLYDAKLRRFLSPDNFVQDPYKTQNYNRYQYAYNNPLLYTDPSGEILGIAGLTVAALLKAAAIGAAVALAVNAIMNVANGNPWWYGAGKSVVVGAVSGAISAGIGQVAKNMVAVGKSSFLFQAGAHGTTGGAMSAIEGGNFVSGFAAGAISSIISSGVQGIAKNLSTTLRDAITIASGGLSGGISSSIAGGNFWRGVKQGLITSGLNHVAHRVASKWEFNSKFNKELKKAYGKNIDRGILNSDKTLCEMVDKVPTLEEIFYSFEKEVIMSASNTISTKEAVTYVIGTRGNDVAHPDTYSQIGITFMANSFNSIKGLAQAMYHEFVHVNDFISGNIHANYIKHGGSLDYDFSSYGSDYKASRIAIALSEINAYRQAKIVTGATFEGTAYQKNVDYLKSKKIKF